MIPESGSVGDAKERSRKRRWSTIVGSLIGLGGAAFVVRTFIANREEVEEALRSTRPALLILGVILGLAAMTGIGLGWHSSIRALGGHLELLDSLRGYFVGQLGKYLPGGIWAVMGRGEWARSKGVAASISYSSVVLSMGSAYLAATLVASSLAPMSGLLGDGDRPAYLLALVFLPIGFALLHPTVIGLLLRMLRRLTRRRLAIDIPSWRRSALIVLQQTPSWILIGTVSIVTAAAFGADVDAINLILATALSWVIGFIVLPVPGGIGIRESAFVALATSVTPGIAAAVAVAARLIFITVDALGALITITITGRRRLLGKDVS